ncbi:glycine zipper 2TM domain-containing protein [Ramlibacter sp. G-1-2-2]|uniref:Glycine zipper 2TM domain-containing protein n=1 Tax=Ramlibacter agri TaxID=2728837 RepID=A0A848HCT8_9BURK|nr:glycine zipper 2TM domain-containing protein [Ramlibacter agri]NML46353.1 glycine zipper 2TM domain-containing protein [Ramlibacter agri]
MSKLTRVSALVVSAGAVAMLAACADYPTYGYNSGPAYTATTTTTTYPVGQYPVQQYPVAGIEYGRISSIEYMPVGTRASAGPNILGAVVGGLAGAALGSTIGGGAGRTAATVLGGVAGAAIGNQVQRNHEGYTTTAGYRIVMQSDAGVIRTFEVPATGDLHVGDRVRVDNGVIYRA